MCGMKILACLALCLLAGCATTPLPEEGEPLVGAIVQRLSLAKDIAWAKWADGLPIRDAEREEAVLAKVEARAIASGMNETSARRFFRAQIEASCREQELWLKRWKAGESLPAGEPPSLGALRERVDRRTSLLLAEWAASESSPPPPDAVRARLIEQGFSPSAAAAASGGWTMPPAW